MLLEAGKLISSTDMKLAQLLNQVISVEDILHGSQPEWFSQKDDTLELMYEGNYFELVAA